MELFILLITLAILAETTFLSIKKFKKRINKRFEILWNFYINNSLFCLNGIGRQMYKFVLCAICIKGIGGFCRRFIVFEIIDEIRVCVLMLYAQIIAFYKINIEV